MSLQKYSWQKQIKDRKSADKKIYKVLRDDFLKDHFICEVCFKNPATDVHHKKGRLGELLTLVRYFLAVCRNCHTWIESHPKEAKDKGYSLSRLNKI